MTPYEIGILLHYYAYAYDHPDLNRNPPAWRPTIDRFVERELLVPFTTHDQHDQRILVAYTITERGRAYVDALQMVQLPVKRWVMPAGWNVIEGDRH